MSVKLALGDSGEQAGTVRQPPLLNGYLKKLGERGIKTYKRRYFRQKGFRLAYYENDTTKEDHSKGEINLEQIQEVRKSSAHANSFELVSKEGKRVYVLQICEPGDSVEQWITRVNAWLAYIKARWNQSILATGGGATGAGGVGSGAGNMKFSIDLLKLSSFTQVDSTSGTDLLANYPEETWPAVLASTEEEIGAQLDAINTLRAEVEELNQKYKIMSLSKDTSVERAKTTLQEELKVLNANVNESHRALSLVDQSLIAKERQVMAAERQLAESAALVELKEQLLQASQETLVSAQKNLSLQEESLIKLRETRDLAASPPAAIPSLIQGDLDRLKRQWMANADQQVANDQVGRQLTHLDLVAQAHERVESNSINKLHKAIDVHQQALTSVRAELADAQHTDETLLNEFESLRKQFFVSLTICIKLQGEVTGRHPAVDLSDLEALFQIAIEQVPDHLHWNDWLAEKMFPGTPKSVILGRRREGSVSAPGSGIQPVNK